jgi:hypothetical protein
MTDEIVTLGSAVGHTSGYLGGGKSFKGKNSTFNKRRGGKCVGGGGAGAAASSSTNSESSTVIDLKSKQANQPWTKTK